MGNTLKFSGLSAIKGTHADEQLDELSVESVAQSSPMMLPLSKAKIKFF